MILHGVFTGSREWSERITIAVAWWRNEAGDDVMSGMSTSREDDLVPESALRAEPMGRGIQWLSEPSVSGSIIGAIGASTFVLANHGNLPDPWSMMAVATWVPVLLVWAGTTLLWRRPRPVSPAPRRGAWAIYCGSVLGMLVLMSAGSAILRALEETSSQPALIALAVGLHFLPFAYAFRSRAFLAIGGIVATIGALGIAGEMLRGREASSSAAVLAGLTMLTIMTIVTLMPRDT